MLKTQKTKSRRGMTTLGGVIAAAVLVGGIVAIVPTVEKKLGFCETEPGVSASESTLLGTVLAAAEPLLDSCAKDSEGACITEPGVEASKTTSGDDTMELVSALIAEESTPFTPIECKLSAAEQREMRDTVLTELWDVAEDIQRTESGVSMRFPADMMHAITDYIAIESDCCSFFSFRLDVPPNSAALSLTISGPPAAQSMIDGMIESIESTD